MNAHAVPENVEYGNSMGVADFTANAQAATSLLKTPAFDLKPGEATNLLTHYFISVALAARVVHRAQAVLRAQETALALTIEGFRANLSPMRQVGSRRDTSGSERIVREDMHALLEGSRLWTVGARGSSRTS